MEDLEFQIAQARSIIKDAYEQIAELGFTNEELSRLDDQLDDAMRDLFLRTEEEIEGEQIVATRNREGRDLANYHNKIL